MVAIVDPKTRRRVGPDATGEVWVSGWAVAQGYWGRSTQPDEVFGARLVDDDVPGRTWLRTGDVGVLSGADLYITGRLKDVLVINGKNHHAEDIEATVKAVDQRIGNGRVAVFGYPAAEDKEKAVVLFSARDISAADNPELISAVRTKIGQEHGVPLHDVRIVRSGTLPVTSSGKIRRRRARELYEQGHWAASTGPEEYAGTRSR